MAPPRGATLQNIKTYLASPPLSCGLYESCDASELANHPSPHVFPDPSCCGDNLRRHSRAIFLLCHRPNDCANFDDSAGNADDLCGDTENGVSERAIKKGRFVPGFGNNCENVRDLVRRLRPTSL